jgi:hypothetical protein
LHCFLAEGRKLLKKIPKAQKMNIPYMKVLIYALTFLGYAYTGEKFDGNYAKIAGI